MKNNKDIAIIGYSGHSYVVLEILQDMGRTSSHYCEISQKEKNPYQLNYLGNENDPQVIEQLAAFECFVAIGDNKLRESTFKKLAGQSFINAIHPSARISGTAKIGKGTMIGTNVIVNAQAMIGNGVICNTGCIIEHECIIGDYAHIAPGAVLCGNVSIGSGTFVGANSVVRQGISIGKNVTIGAGTVVTKNIPDDCRMAGNPPRLL